MDYDAIIELLIGHGYILSDDKERATILLRKANYPEPSESAKGEADELHRAICALNENMPLGLEWAMDIVRDTLLAARRPSAEPARDIEREGWEKSVAWWKARAEKAEAKAKQWHEAYDRELDDIATVRSEL